MLARELAQLTDPWFSSGIFKNLDADGSGSIELNFQQVRTKKPVCVRPEPAVEPHTVLTLTPPPPLLLLLQWLNFAMIWAAAPWSPGRRRAADSMFMYSTHFLTDRINIKSIKVSMNPERAEDPPSVTCRPTGPTPDGQQGAVPPESHRSLVLSQWETPLWQETGNSFLMSLWSEKNRKLNPD